MKETKLVRETSEERVTGVQGRDVKVYKTLQITRKGWFQRYLGGKILRTRRSAGCDW